MTDRSPSLHRSAFVDNISASGGNGALDLRSPATLRRILLSLIAAITGGYSLAYGVWAVLNRQIADQVIRDGPSGAALELPSAPQFLAVALVLLSLASTGIWVYSRRRRLPFLQTWLSFAPYAALLNLLTLLLYVYWQWQNHWKHDLFVAVVASVVVGTLGTWLITRSARIGALDWIRDHVDARLVAWALGLAFAVAGTVFGILRHSSFNSNARDLGMMDQLVWNTAHGRVLEGTLFGSHYTNFLGHHFSPILIVLAPLYWLSPSPEMLIGVQSIAIALAAVLLYHLTVRLTGSALTAIGLEVALIVSPFVHEGILFDFHQDALGVLFLVTFVWSAFSNRRFLAIASWLLALACKEELAIYFGVLGLYEMLISRDWRRTSRALLFVSLNAGYLLVVVYAVIPLFQIGADGSFSFFSRYRSVGGSFAGILNTLAVSPVYMTREVLLRNRVVGLAAITLPFLPMLLAVRRAAWLVLLAPLAINSLSDSAQQHIFGAHYGLLPVAMLTLAVALALRGPRYEAFLTRSKSFLLLSSMCLFVWLSPLGLDLPLPLQTYTADDHDRLGYQVLALIPEGACVSAQNNLAPHLSQRECLSLFPIESGDPESNDPMAFYALDVTGSTDPLTAEEYREQVRALLHNKDYAPVSVTDGYILLERGGGDPSLRPLAIETLESLAP